VAGIAKNLFTAAQVAHALQRSKRSVLESLKGIVSMETKIINGNETRAWSKDALPPKILAALSDAAAQRKTSVDALLASPALFWRPRYPVSELSQESISRASLLKGAFAPALVRLNDVDLTTDEFERLGVKDYRRAFGHGISTRHWRRLLGALWTATATQKIGGASKSISTNRQLADRS
jgi:hypothetical protein